MAIEMTAAERFRQHIESTKEAVIVDVLAPSGFIYKFREPSKFGMLFRLGKLPQSTASAAAEKWTEAGIIKGIEQGDPDTMQLANAAFSTRDQVLALSYSPKWVVGNADPAKDEISTDDIPDADIAYCFQWVQAGGDMSLMLNTFPGGPQSNAVAQSNRKERRAKAKQARRAT